MPLIPPAQGLELEFGVRHDCIEDCFQHDCIGWPLDGGSDTYRIRHSERRRDAPSPTSATRSSPP